MSLGGKKDPSAPFGAAVAVFAVSALYTVTPTPSGRWCMNEGAMIRATVILGRDS